MKKLTSLLLAFAMLFSLTMPAMAADISGNTSGNVSGTYNPTVTITGVSLIVDGVEHKEGLVTLTAANSVELKVYGANLQYGSDTQMILYEPQGSMSMSNAYGWEVSPDGTWATVSRDIIDFSKITAQHTLKYSNNDGSEWLDSNVFVIYDSSEDAAITGVSITVDGVPYTSGNVTVYSDSEVTVTVTGSKLTNATQNHLVNLRGNVDCLVSGMTVSDDGTRATLGRNGNWFAGCENFEIRYCSDWTTDRTWQNTGIFVTYNEGTKPVPTYVTFIARLKAVDSQGSEVTGVTGYLDGNRIMNSTHGTYPDTSTGTHTIGEFTVSTEGYKLPPTSS